MDNEKNNVYDVYINNATMNNDEAQISNYNIDNPYQEYENIIKNKEEILVEYSDNCYSDYPSEESNHRRK